MIAPERPTVSSEPSLNVNAHPLQVIAAIELTELCEQCSIRCLGSMLVAICLAIVVMLSPLYCVDEC
jgi:hypothetical protein